MLSEGDSISIKWSGNHTGIYAANNPRLDFWGKAVGGSGVAGLESRFDADAALKPEVVTVLIGANDLNRWNATDATPFLNDLWTYTAKWKASGAKVVVGTILGQCLPNNPTATAKHNALRSVANSAIRAAVGTKIDGVYDFAADKVMGTDAAACNTSLFSDGVHPTDSGQVRLAPIYAQAVNKILGISTPVATDSMADMPMTDPMPATEPVPAVPLGGYVKSPTLAGAPDLVANFPVEQGLKPSWGTGAIPGLYGGEEGAFRLTCGGEGPLIYDDPLVLPGKAGASHLHYFWGQMNVNANSTASTLAASIGNNNCNYGPKTLNRSAYWMPALMNASDQALKTDWIAVYYKEPMASSSRCTPGSKNFEGICVGLPNQIRLLFGWDYTKPDAAVQGASWYCTGGTNLHYKNLDDVFNSGCRAGDTLVANLVAPNCWDGKNLDSPDHRSHTAYGSYGNWGYYKCPATHPYVIPQNESKLAWTVTADMYEKRADGKTYSRLHLVSDHMKPNAKPGETLHTDYIESWVGKVKKMWQDNCINKGLDCSGGDLGNGLQLIGASQPSYGWINPNPKAVMPMADMKM